MSRHPRDPELEELEAIAHEKHEASMPPPTDEEELKRADDAIASFQGAAEEFEKLDDEMSAALEDEVVKNVQLEVEIHRLRARPDMLEDIKDFHEKFGLAYDGKPRLLIQKLAEFRAKFMEEELIEYKLSASNARLYADNLGGEDCPRSMVTQEMSDMLDALVDEVYVVLGTAYLHGFDFAEAWRRVHAANMKKVRVTRASDSKRGSSFDVVKPEGWIAPDHRDLVEDFEVE